MKILHLCAIASAAMLLLSTPTPSVAYSSNWDHELGVYHLCEYGTAADGEPWKHQVCPSEFLFSEPEHYEPAGMFWALMISGDETTGSESESKYAHHGSRRRVNADVNIHTIFPIDGDGWKDWDQFDLVFFQGHANMITRAAVSTGQDPNDPEPFWSNNDGDWQEVEGLFADWGTTRLPYEYYWQDVTTGEDRPGGVIYLHEPYTSVLLGYHFDGSYPSFYQLTAQETPEGTGQAHIRVFNSGLGDNDLEWLILRGCGGVIVADVNGTGYLDMGVEAYRRTFGKFHIILGHYRDFTPASLTDLELFADDLISGVPIQQAYFQADPANNTAAISAECVPGDITDPAELFEYVNSHGFMDNDTWTDPLPDNDGCEGTRIWFARWLRGLGETRDEWETE